MCKCIGAPVLAAVGLLLVFSAVSVQISNGGALGLDVATFVLFIKYLVGAALLGCAKICLMKCDCGIPATKTKTKKR